MAGDLISGVLRRQELEAIRLEPARKPAVITAECIHVDSVKAFVNYTLALVSERLIISLAMLSKHINFEIKILAPIREGNKLDILNNIHNNYRFRAI